MARGISTGPTRAGVVEKVAEKVVRRRLSGLEVVQAAVGGPGAQPTRVVEERLSGSGRGSAPGWFPGRRG